MEIGLPYNKFKLLKLEFVMKIKNSIYIFVTFLSHKSIKGAYSVL